MKKQNEIQSRDKVVKTYWICCPECDKEIKGNSASHVGINLKFHMMKHDQEKLNKKK